MKNFTLLFLLAPFIAFSQTLIENKKDEFTGNTVKETSVEKLVQPFKMSGFAYNFSVKKVNDSYYFDLRMMSINAQIFSIQKDSKFMLKLKNDSVITLISPTYEISTRGGAGGGLTASSSYGISIYYPIAREYVDAIIASDVAKIRVYTSDGYTEQELKDAASEKIKKAFRLVL